MFAQGAGQAIGLFNHTAFVADVGDNFLFFHVKNLLVKATARRDFAENE